MMGCVKRRSFESGVSSFRFLVSGSTLERQRSETNNLKPETRNLKRLNEIRFTLHVSRVSVPR